MAKEPPTISKALPTKLPKLPPNTKIQKRPIIHPPIASPRTSASTPKIVYISASSPFIAVVKRVRGFLAEIEHRSSGNVDLHSSRSLPTQINDALKDGKGGPRSEEVTLKATGKAIQKLLSVAIHFQGQGDLNVSFKTGSVGAVDDIVPDGMGEEQAEGSSRVRRSSCLEVLVGLR